MQELHAAEILDMESRHISEAETLKRDHYVAVQLLTEECSTLKAVIQCLRSKEVFGFHNVFFQHSVVGFFFPPQKKFYVVKRQIWRQFLPYNKTTI